MHREAYDKYVIHEDKVAFIDEGGTGGRCDTP